MGLPDIETIPETGAVFTIGRSRFADNVASHFFIRKDPVVAITCGDEHSAVVCQTGRLFVFGSNDWGQLGLGHKNHISKPSCVKRGQKIFACGSNQEGQLGRESSAIGDSSSSPILIYDCGLAGPRVLQVAAGSHHSMALTSDGGVIAWGSNLEGQLGLPGISGLVTKPTKVPIPEPVKEISAGYYHSAFLTESGLVYVCGESESGKLGIDVNFSTQVAPKQMQLPAPALHVACGGHHTLVLAANGNIYCSGSNANGQLGMGTNVNEVHTPKLLPRGALQDETIVKVACGESHSAILTESGKLFTCGDGRHGKLGLEENENNVHEITLAAKYQELFVSNVSCGGCHTILVGRRHEMNYQSQRQSDATQMEQSQKINSLPPLKLPVNMQNEQRLDNAESKSTSEKEKINDMEKINDTEKINEEPQNNNDESSSLENATMNNSNLVNSTSKKDEDNESHEESSENVPSENPERKSPIEESQPTGDEDQSKVEENEQNDKNNESKENSNESDKTDSQDDNEKTENAAMREAEESHTEEAATTVTDETERETSMNTIPPPKPPRIKSGNAEDTSNNEKESLKESNGVEEIKKEEGEEEAKESDERIDSAKSSDKKPKSAAFKRGDEDIVDVTENSIDKVEEDGHSKDPEKSEMDGTQDDADVVQSPAPRTGKMAKLFKAKRQQEIQNGNTGSVANPKAKSKTCTIL
ncbi:PREDICTED: X-linked retinitis pigmentosa GTPase regulator [Dinoponera quadriceps]|uniref:X-linked retinitis pigmentosa GTPase regulator n=1 Tax=Dinoponera quadriceps TaxID=609295 RepID=A0A6P3WP45_DINQU|nr:PREDICTED: X-linked retinitis pigmentosa GTPase regulator [Dinoponera quadriceps]